jgi:hypothetical protein
MKLPKRIADILKKKQAFIDSQRTRLETTVVRLQSRLLNDILLELIPELDVKDGVILETAKNYRLVSVLDKTYRDFQKTSNPIVLNQIVTGTAKITAISNSYFGVVLSGSLPERFESIVEKSNKLINLRLGLDGSKLVRGGFLESFFNSNTLGTDLKQMTSRAITSGVGLKEYTKMLRDKITGTEEYAGGMERQFQRYAYDLYQQYDAAYNLTLGNEFGFTYFVYQGGLIEDSRDFCAAHNGKVWSKEETETWSTWTPAQGEYPAGYIVKQKDQSAVPSYLGYPGYDPMIDRGGYNCRHFLGWIPDDVAFDMRPELKEE